MSIRNGEGLCAPRVTLRHFLPRPLLAFCLSVSVLFLLNGCQSFPPPQSAQVETEQQLVVPFVPQEKYQCGPAALAMMLQWAGKPVSADRLVDEVWLPEREGSLGIELRAAARSRGLMAYPVEDSEALFQELQAGRPVLVLQNLALRRWPQWHFAVVTGYRDQGNTMVLHSGTDAGKTTHWNRFIRTWARADQWGFTLVEPGQLPASAEPEALFRAISAVPNADAFWPAAVDAFPDSGQLWFGHGNSLWAKGQQQAALEAFRQATRKAPDFAAAWNNLAYAQQALGDDETARTSICRAQTLAPDDAGIRESVKELTGQSCPSSDTPSANDDCCAAN
ncbi:MAG: PA2778 family cysteine peptidase [Pseudomonadota bacterium]|nr:PA2778 family cysteine peptidase [Pseudomonadota bacterium]